MSDVLKKAGYTIPEHCGICVHSTPYAVLSGRCTRLDSNVYLAGSCKYFDPDKVKVEVTMGPTSIAFLNKRRYTRSNRHKSKTSY